MKTFIKLISELPFRTQKIKTTKTTLIKCLVLVLLIQPFLSFSLFAQDKTDNILKAYDTRMNGKVEDAKTILTKVLETDSTNALAHFEMARTIEDQGKSYHIEKALLYDPDNPMYRFYQANLYMLEAYKAMRNNETTIINENVQKCFESLKSILEVKPNCKESLLFLIDLYGSLPADMGGNIKEANIYLEKLKQVDPLYAAQGNLILASKEGDLDIVNYWKEYIHKNGENLDVLVKLGKANLMNNDIEKAKACFDPVIKEDPSQNRLYLDIARAHLYNAMRGGDNKDDELDQFKKNINIYLNSKESNPVILEAWCYGWLGLIEQRQGNQELANNYIAKAEGLMPNYPRFTAIPKVDVPPDVMAYEFSSYFTPF